MDYEDTAYEGVAEDARHWGTEHHTTADRSSEPRPRGRPRECWICKATVYPTYAEPSYLDSIRGKPPRRVYEDEDGRLICPCNCKGSIKWVHETCLQEWRYQSANTDNYWKCRTCGFRYQFERMDWARRVRSPVLAFGLAAVIFVFLIFLLGFIGDYILDFWLDPTAIMAGFVGMELDDWDDVDADRGLGIADLDENSWSFHFVKGLFSLGLLGFVKSFVVMSPFQWWNLRTSGLVGGGRRRGTGRDRLENVSLTLVIIGAVSFFWVSSLPSRRWISLLLTNAPDGVECHPKMDQEGSRQGQRENGEHTA